MLENYFASIFKAVFSTIYSHNKNDTANEFFDLQIILLSHVVFFSNQVFCDIKEFLLLKDFCFVLVKVG